MTPDQGDWVQEVFKHVQNSDIAQATIEDEDDVFKHMYDNKMESNNFTLNNSALYRDLNNNSKN